MLENRPEDAPVKLWRLWRLQRLLSAHFKGKRQDSHKTILKHFEYIYSKFHTYSVQVFLFIQGLNLMRQVEQVELDANSD